MFYPINEPKGYLRKSRRLFELFNPERILLCRFFPGIASMLLALILMPLAGRAQTLYWNVGGPAPSGIWDDVTPNWSTSGTGTGLATDWTDGNIAIFSAGNSATGSYTITLSGTETANGVTFQIGTATLTSGTLALTGTGGVAVNASPVEGIIASPVTGSVGLTKTGTGQLDLQGTNTFTGNLTNEAGILTLDNNQAGGQGAIVLSPSLNLPVTLNSSMPSTTVTNNVGLSSGTSTVEIDAGLNNTLVLSGTVSGTHAWNVNGSGTLVLSNENNFSGALSVQQGTLVAASGGALGSENSQNTINVASGATLAFEGGYDISGNAGGVTLNGSGFGGGAALNNMSGDNLLDSRVILNANSSIGAAADSLTLNQPISGSYTLTKVGNGEVDLYGAPNSYGNTIVSGGVLGVWQTSSAGTGLVTVNASAILAGDSGSAAPGGVSLSGMISPGNGLPASLGTASETWNGGGGYDWTINDANGPSGTDPGYATLNITGTLAINATSASPFIIYVSSLGETPAAFDNTREYQWIIASTTGGITGFNPSDFTINASQFTPPLGGGGFRLLVSGTNLILEFDPAPVISCPEPITQGNDLNECSANVVFAATATNYPDLDPITISYDTNGVPITSPCVFPKGTTTVNSTATDAAGDTATCSFTVTVNDVQPPTIITPATNQTIVANNQTAHASLPNITGEVVASDNCGNANLTYSQIPAAGTTVGLGPQTVTVWATDQSGNSNSCTATIYVIYTNPPALSFVPNVTVTTTQDKDPYATGFATATNADGPVTVTYSDNYTNLTECDSTGFILRTWKAVDASTNVSTGVQTINVVDTNAPYFAYLPSTITSNDDLGQCSAVVNYTPVAEDPGYFQGFENTNWISNTNAPGATLDWSDYQSAMYRVPSGSNGIISPNGVAYAVIDSTVPQAGPDYSNSGAFTLLGGLSSWQFETIYGYNGVRSSFGFGYRASLEVYVNLNDPAVVNATETNGYAWDLTTSASGTNDNVAINYLSDFVFHAAAYDSSGVVIAVSTQSSDSATNRGSDLRAAGPYATITNSGWYKFEWNFYSNSDSTLSVDMKVRDSSGAVQFAQTVTNGTPVSQVDGHPNLMWFTFLALNQLPIADSVFERNEPVVSTPVSGAAFPVGTTTVTSTTADACGNSTNATFTVTVNDVQPPTLVSNVIMVDLDAGGNYTLSQSDISALVAGSSDACGLASTNVSPSSFDCANVGANTVTVTLANTNGLSSTAAATIIVKELNPPTLVLQPITVYLDAGGNYTLSQSDISALVAGSSATCGLASTNVSLTTFGCANVGQNNLVTVVLTDVNGNSTTNSTTVNVRNLNPPTVVLHPITVSLDADGDYTLSPSDIATLIAGSSSVCGIASTEVTPHRFECVNAGPNPITVVLTDVNGNSATNTVTITVQDVTPPVIVTHPLTVTLGTNGAYTLTGSDEASMVAGSSDNCGIASTNFNPSSFGFCDAGNTQNVIVTMTDIHGNPSMATVPVTVNAPASPPAVVYVDASYPTNCGPVPFPYTGGSGTYYVGYNAFNTIQGGLNAVASGGTVTVAAGTYNESPLINNPVTLTSIGGTNAALTTIVLPNNPPTTYVSALTINASSVNVEGFTIVGYDSSGAYAPPTYGEASVNILLNQATATTPITNIDIGNNIVEVGAISTNNNVYTGSDGFGLETTYPVSPTGPLTSDLVVHNNLFEPVDAPPAYDTFGNAFFVNPAGNFTFVSNTITGGLAQSTTSATNSLIANNTVIGIATNDNSGGFATFGYPDPDVYGHAVITDNTISNVASGIAVYDSEHVTIESNLLNGVGVGVGVYDSGYDPVYPAGNTVQIFNNSLAYDVVGFVNDSSNSVPVASSNWWGDVSGPASAQNPYGTGSPATGNVTIQSWLENGGNASTGTGFAPTAPEVYPPTQLVFTTEPGGVNLGSLLSPQPVVTVEDASGNVTPWVAAYVTIAISNNPTGYGLLTGTTNQITSDGVATFDDLAIAVDGGAGDTLEASATNLAPALSTSFDIQNPAPVVGSLSPFFARAGGGSFTLTVNGSGFVASSQVYWNDSPIGTTYVSGTRLTAAVPAGDIASVDTASVMVASPGPGGGTSSTLTFTIVPAAPPVVYVDANYANLPPNTLVTWPYSGNPGTNIIGYNAFATIQGGVGAVAYAGTVNVAAGTYTEEVTIAEPMRLLGPNATNNPCTGLRGPEAVIEPDMNGPDIINDANPVEIVSIETSNVVIKGFTVDGYNPNLSGAFQSGSDFFNAATGIGDYTGDNSIRIENNIVKNDAYAGVDLESDGIGSPPNTNSFIKCNLFENMDYNAEGFGVGIILYNNYYAEISGNCLTNVAIGISPQSYFLPNPGNQNGQTIANNKVSASLLGIWLNLVYESASTFQISDNASFFMPTNGSALYGPVEWDGYEITSIQSAAGVVASNNVVIGPSGSVGYNAVGYNVWNTPTTNEVLIEEGAISNVNYGVWVNDYDGYQSPGGSTTATISNVVISTASLAGVYVQDDPRASTPGVVVQATVTGNTVITGSGDGVLVQGNNAAATVINNSASITGNSVGVFVDTGKALIQGNDLTGNTVAAIGLTNNAIVDAGDCSGSDVTRLGTGSGAGGSSSGGNNLSGYGFDNAAPWAIENFNAGSTPAVLAENNNFGAVVGDNIPAAFLDPNMAIVYSQAPAVISAPTNVTVVCASDVPAAATSLSQFNAQGGYFSGNNATVSSSDNPPYPYPDGNITITRTYTVSDGCNPAICVQTITVDNTNPPTFGGLMNLAFYTDPGESTKSNVTWTVTATSYCGSPVPVVSTPASGSTFEIGTNTVTVMATDASGNTNMATFTVTVVGVPQIISQPQSLTNNAGTTATFTVVASSPVPLTYQWLKNDGIITGATNATLQLPDVSDSDAASYSVQVSNPAGTVTSSNATLTVIDPPVITDLTPVSQTNNATTVATFTVSVTGTPPFSYQWTKITATETNVLSNGGNIVGATNNELTISNVLAADQAEYLVTVSNPAGTPTTNGMLFVIDPVITNQPVSITNSLGSTVNFSVSAVGTTPLSYQWQEDGFNLPGETGSTLTLNNIEDSDAGDYTVVVSNSVGEAISDIATLTITHPPVITAQPLSLTVNQGQTATFSVAVDGDTPFTYQWFQNGSPLNSGGNILGATSDELVLQHVTTANAGSYFVAITNDVGETNSLSVTLTVVVPPAITTQPVGLTNNAGTTATFTVGASGTAPSFQWYQITATATNTLTDGGNIFGATSNVLTITNVLGADDAYYVAVASNQAGTAASTNAILVVIDPIITNEPSSQTVNLGTSATFSVGAYGTSPQYQWYQNGTIIDGANAATYTIASVADSNAGAYTVVVSNAFGAVTSTPPAVLTIIDPPVITGQPQNLTANAGATAVFAVTNTGTSPGYQWYYDSTPLSNGGNVSGANGPVLTLMNVQDGNAGSYSVVLNNAAGVVTSSNATLTVIDPPVIASLQPSSQTNNATTTAQFTVNVGTGTTPFTYQWTKITANSTDVLSNGGNIIGATSNVLTIVNVLGADQAEYVVTVSNPAGTVTTNGTLVVIDPAIFVQPVGQTNFIGSTVSFSVTAAGTSPLGYQWQQNGSPLFQATNSTLILTNIADSDAGNYTVIVTNSVGSVTSTPALLVTVSPLITTQPTNVVVLQGQSASFSVNVNGETPFSYQWQFNGTNIPGATDRIYTISSTVLANAGNYQVVVVNPVGTQVSQPATLIVVVPPAITGQPTNINAVVGQTVNFTVTATGIPLNYQWYFNNSGVPSANSNVLTLANITTNNAGLYYVTVTNTAGALISSNVTLAVYPTAAPNLTIVAHSNNIVDVTVTGVPGYTYTLQYSTNLINWKTVEAGESPFMASFRETYISAEFYRALYQQ